MASPAESKDRAKILLVEDELILRKNLARFLRRTGHEVVSVGDSDEALLLLARQSFDVLITDLFLPSGGAFPLAEKAKSVEARVIVMTAYGSPQIEEMLRAVGVFAYLEKPLRLETLHSLVQRALTECIA